MTYQDLQDAFDLADATWDGLKYLGPPQTEERIVEAERLLGHPFPTMYRMFLKKYGSGGTGSFEVMGLCMGDLIEAGHPNVVGCTLEDRSRYDMPPDVICISPIGDGDFYALDLAHCDLYGEPQVIVWPIDGTPDREDVEVEASDFGEFLLNHFEAALEMEAVSPNAYCYEKDGFDLSVRRASLISSPGRLRGSRCLSRI